MSPRRTPRGQQPPPNTTHGLLKPPKLEKPLPVGQPPEVLHHGTHESRIVRYRKAIRTLERLIADDEHLAERVKRAEDALFPGGNSAKGARSTDISDPTGGAATSGRIKDAAERAWESADTAMKALWWAETHRKRAETVSASETPEAQERFAKELAQLTGKKPAPEPEDGACENCAKAKVFSERGRPPSVPKDCTLCVYCWQIERTYGMRPTREILRRHHDRGRVYRHEYEAMVAAARADGRLQSIAAEAS